MENNIITVKSASNFTIVVNVPEIQLRRVWKKRGQSHMIERTAMIQAYYDPGVEYLFKQGMLTTDDIEFLKYVGLMEDDGTTEIVVLTDQMVTRLVKNMPVNEFKLELKKLSRTQLEELVDYAIEHYKEMQMDKIEVLSELTGKNVMKAIEHYRKAQEV